MGVFLDIRGAFDNVNYDYIKQAMTRRGIDSSTIQWYMNFLRVRQGCLTIKGLKLIRLLRRDFPQGGILSPFIWNIIFDELIALFERTVVNCFAFADDLLLLMKGQNIAFMVKHLQKALDKAEAWAKAAGLQFCPVKTVAVVFTRQRKIPTPPLLRIGGRFITYAQEAKYLGML